jgi:hypothetical protein
MKIIYLNCPLWEDNFIMNDVLFDITDKELEVVKKENYTSLFQRTDIIKNCIIALSSNHIFDTEGIAKLLKHVQPNVIIYLSDEWGRSKEIIPKFEIHTKLFLRQYNNKGYVYGTHNYQMPLAYVNKYLSGKNSFSIEQKKMKDRDLNVSFIGSKKSDRLHMAEVFRKGMTKTRIEFVCHNWNINKLPYTPEQCFAIYNNSIFVICGRGNVHLDSFRIYETIVAGAIPILVGNEEDIEYAFHYNGARPPILFGKSWEDVVEKSNMLLNDCEKLQKHQDELIAWWKDQILFLNNLIKNEFLIKID